MTGPSPQFSIWRHLTRSQIILALATGFLAATIAVLVLGVYVNILTTNSAFGRGYVVTDLSDIQRALLILHRKTNEALLSDPVDFDAIDLQRALVTSQLRLARTEAAGIPEIVAGFADIQRTLDEYDELLTALRSNPSSDQIALIAPELDRLLAELDIASKNFSNRQENTFFDNISSALRTQRTVQTILLVLSTLLVLFGIVLIFSLRRSIKGEFDRAYFQLEAEVVERQQAEAALRKANRNLQSLNAHLQEELLLARKIQKSLLPPPHPNWNGIDVVCYSSPADEVGGDFYAYNTLDEGRFTLAVGDVSGKGLSAALLMATTLAHFDSTFAFAISPADLLVRLDQTLVRYTQTTRQNCALCYVEINGLTLNVANAGGIPPYIRRVNGDVEFLDVRGMPLGMGVGAENGYQPLSVELTPGDLVILTSDGLVEAHVTPDQLFSFDRLEQSVATGPTVSAKAMLEHLRNEVSIFIGNTPPHDDVTIVVMQVKA
jgi:serine phosphatase RsbU (regulator of sigma subunit)